MSASQLKAAAQLLYHHYGRPSSPGPPGRWTTLVAVVLDDRGLSPLPRRLQSVLETSTVGQPGETEQASVEEIAALLKGVPRAKQKASILKTLAAWWIERFGDEREVVWELGLEESREQLSRLRGVGLEMVDRVLLFVGGLPTYPLDRSSIRIACRHGWLGLETEYEEWQSFFVSGLGQGRASVWGFSRWAAQVGRDCCGAKPKCESCPLESLLPEGGPYEPDES